MLRKKLSGSENRKRNAAKETEREKQRGQLNKFFKSTYESPQVPSSKTSPEFESTSAITSPQGNYISQIAENIHHGDILVTSTEGNTCDIYRNEVKLDVVDEIEVEVNDSSKH